MPPRRIAYSDAQKQEWTTKGEELVAGLAYDLLTTFRPIDFQQLGQTISSLENVFPKQINDESLLFLIENKIIDYSCAKEVMEGYKNGLTIDQIALYAKKNPDSYLMRQLRKQVEEQDLKTRTEMIRKQVILNPYDEINQKLMEEQKAEETRRQEEQKKEEEKRAEERRREEEKQYNYSSRKDCMLAVMINGMNLALVPAILQSPEIIMLALDNNKDALECVVYQEDYKKALQYQISGEWPEDEEVKKELEDNNNLDKIINDANESVKDKQSEEIESQPQESALIRIETEAQEEIEL